MKDKRKMIQALIRAEDYFKTLDGLYTPAVLLALVAINKQIPKKPIQLTAHGNCQACPNCKSVLENGKTVRFCQVCGQAIK